MGVNFVNKTISKNQISCNDTFQITLALTASPDIVNNPVDVFLVLDRSGSMAGEALENLQIGAKTFVEIIAESTGGTSEIEGGSRIGIVSFSSTAVLDTPLTTSVAALNSSISNLIAGGSTNHAAAFTTAVNSFDSASANRRILVMFTDGKTNVGPDPDPIAADAKAMGITIYCIGLEGDDGIDETQLNTWATPPPSSHVSIAPDAADLETLFQNLANNISRPGATEIVIHELLHSDFQIVSVNSPTKGSVTQTSSTALQWNMDVLGERGSESAELTFTVQHIGTEGGLKEVNSSILYQDKEGNIVTFPNPEIYVDCGIHSCIGCVSCKQQFTAPGCQDSVLYNLDDLSIESTGRIVQLELTLKNVCPAKEVALAVLLNELDDTGHEIKRGFKILTVPAHNRPSCTDIHLECIRFILPDGSCTPASASSVPAHCQSRNFVVRGFANYLGYDFIFEETQGTCD